MVHLSAFRLFSVLSLVFVPLVTVRGETASENAAIGATTLLSSERLESAGENRAEIEKALAMVPDAEREGMLFLLQYMPVRDLRTLSSDFLLENTRLAYESRRSDPWAKEIPLEIFLNNTLPYASINERRDHWRADFRARFLPLVKDAKTPSEVTAILNQKIFGMVNVRYSTKRKKADQSPFESIEGGTASCTGLSVLLIDACRAVGVPARLVGTPLWSDNSGNHSWVEIWDQGWHFTGAAEPTGMKLNAGWFIGRASTARRDDPAYAIYATSFQDTPIDFPCVWAPHIDDIPAINVTDRYTALRTPIPPGHLRARFVVFAGAKERVAVPLRIRNGKSILFDGTSKDERFDANDHVTVTAPAGTVLQIHYGSPEASQEMTVTLEKDQQLFSLQNLESISKPTSLQASEPPSSDQQPEQNDLCSPVTAEAPNRIFSSTTSPARETSPADIKLSKRTISQLKAFLAEGGDLDILSRQPFAQVSLTNADSIEAKKILQTTRKDRIRDAKQAILDAGVIKFEDFEMPFSVKAFGEKPADGWSVYLSLHGGGGAPAKVNDNQWENQKRLYKLEEGLYVVPRAPTNTWNLWHQGHIDPMFVDLIDALVVAKEANWNRVYVMGYSAGGDGVYQLAPRMADRWAAAAMMAGHPNETSPLGLRNVPFALQMGGKDSAYNRNKIAEQWQVKLAELQREDPEGYIHFVKIYPDSGHWMNLEDRVAIPWMAQYTRNPAPKKIVWKQDNVLHTYHYWLQVDEDQRKPGTEVRASVDGQKIEIISDSVSALRVHLDDSLVDLDQPVQIVFANKTVFRGIVPRTIQNMAETLQARFDPNLTFPAAVQVSTVTDSGSTSE